MAGQKIRELIADYLTAGIHTLAWDGKDANGNAVSSESISHACRQGNILRR